MNHLEEAVCTYAKELGENRLEYSTAQLKDAKEKLKQTYLTLKEDNPNAHNNVEFMKAYRSAHGIIQHELRMRDQDSSVSVKSILGGANSGFAQGKVLTRIKRKLILGDAKHTPAEYLSLCDQLEKGNYIDINAKNDDVQGFRQFITTTYETNYRPPAESLGSRLAEIEELCSAKQDTPMNTYAVNTMGHNWLGDLNARKSEDISGLLEERSFVLRQKLIERRVRFNAGMGIPVNVRTTSSKKEINLVENVQNFFNNAKKYFTLPRLQPA